MKWREKVLWMLFFLGFLSSVKAQKEDSVRSSVENIRIGYLWTSEERNVGLVTAEKIDKRASYLNPYFSIQGVVPGLVISRTDGQEGNNALSHIRGLSSLFLSSQPLIVLNGYPLHDFETSAAGPDLGFGTRASLDPLRFINQKDIQSIHVLRDLASTTIYGSRGANGVILIETSSSKPEQLTYSTTLNFSSASGRYELLNASEFVSAFTQFSTSSASPDFGNEVDWQDEISRTTLSSQHHFRYSKPLKNGYFETSLGYERYNGIISETSGENVTGSLAGKVSFFDRRFSVGASLVGSSLNEDTPPISSNAGARGDLFSSALTANPTWSPHPDSSQNIGALVNPNNLERYHADVTKSQRLVATIDPYFQLFSTTSIGLRLGADLSRSDRTSAVSRLSNNLNRGVEGNGRAALNDIDQQDFLVELKIEDHRKIGNTTVDFILGYSDQQFDRDIRSVEAWGFDESEPDDILEIVRSFTDELESSIVGDFQQFGISESLNVSGSDNFFVNRLDPVSTEISTFSSDRPLSSLGANYSTTSTRIKSYFGRVLFDVDSKYGISVSSRVDNSNLYSDLEFFGSAGLSWKLHNEPFIGDWASLLNLKLSYGTAGNLGANRASSLIFNNQVVNRFEDIPVGAGGGINISGPIAQFENDDLTLERSSEWNITSEFAINGSGVEGQLSLYSRKSTNITSIASTPLFTFGLQNVGNSISNKGIEFEIGHSFTKNLLTVSTEARISYNKNEVTELDRSFITGLLFGQGLSGGFSQLHLEGFPLFSYYLREFQGYDSEGFQILGALEKLDKSAVPTTVVGLDFGLDYKKLTLDFSFYGHFGHYVYRNTENAFFSTGAIAGARNVTRETLSSEQSIFATNSASTQFLERGDFLRCRSIILNYSLDVGESKLSELEVFGVVQNPFILTGYSGLDPEVNVQVGIDYLAYPMARTYSLGFKASF